MSKTTRAYGRQRGHMEEQGPRDLGVGGMGVEDRVREEGQ